MLRLLDTPHFERSKRRQDIAATRPAALLLYLAAHGDWLSREALAEVFSPESDESSARHHLRVLLNRARAFEWAEALEVEPTRLRFVTVTDVQAFRQAIANGDFATAVALYRKPFLSGFQLESGGFASWRDTERELLARAWRDAALRQARQLVTHDPGSAATLLRQVLAEDTLAEDVLAAYLESAYLAGQRDEALRAFALFERQLREELDLEPLESTRRLMESVRRAETPAANLNATLPPRVPLAVQHPPVLIGRTSERGLLERSETRLALVSGEPGAGKTRLLAEVAPDGRWLRCREGLEGLPYQPVIDLIRSDLAALPDLGPYQEDLARLIPEVMPGHKPAPAEAISAKTRLLEAFARALEASERPLLADDLHWADAATLELLALLAARGKLRLIGAYRSTEVRSALRETVQSWRSSGAAEVKLEPLSSAEIRELLAKLIGAPEGPQRFSAWLGEKSGGNVFFALELLRSLFASGALEERDAQWHTLLDDLTQDYQEFSVPERIAGLIERRVSQLSESTQRVLQAAAVLRENLRPEWLGAIAGLSEWGVLEALEEAERAQVIKDLRFCHDLLRQSVYASLPELRRRLLHARAAQTLESALEPLVIAEHWFAAKEPERAFPKWLEAANDYRQLGLHTQAIATLTRAIQSVPEAPASLEAQVQLAEIYSEADQLEAGTALIASLLPTITAPSLRAQLLNTKASLLLRRGLTAEAKAAIAQASELVSKLDNTHLNYNLRGILGQLAYFESRYADALRIYETERDLQKDRGPSLELVGILGSLGTLHDTLGNYETLLSYAQQELSMAQTLNARHAQVSAAASILMAHTRLGNIEDQALATGEAALKLGWYESSDALRNNLVAAYNMLGRNQDVLRHSEIMARESPDPRFRAASWSRMGRIHAQTGNTASAEAAFQQALEILPSVMDQTAVTSVGLAVLGAGSEHQKTRVLPLLRAVQPTALSASLRSRLEEALQRHL